MFNNDYSLADVAAATKNDDTFGGNGAWWLIVLFLFMFANNGNGFGNTASTTASGITDGYILTSDFASLERQMENGFDRLASQGVQIANGISSLGYDQLNQMNGINTNISNAATNITAGITGLGTQMASCCCEQKYENATNFANLNYNLAEQSCQTRQAVADASAAIIANQNDNTKSILDFLTQDKIATLQAENQALKFAASQQAQNTYLVNALTPNYSYPCACNTNIG